MASSNDENNSYDFEASIQISRILKILSDTIKNTEIIMCLPLMLENDCEILKRFFPEDQVSFIRETCEKTTKAQTSPETGDSLLTDNICLVVDLMLSVPDLGDFCRLTLIDAISPGGAALLRNLEELRMCVSERLRVTPKMEAQQDAELRQLYQQNIRSRGEVERLTEKLNKLVAETEQEIEGKKQLIKSQIDKIAKVRKQCRDIVKKKMDDSERQISWDVKNSEYRLEELQTGAKNVQHRREVQLKDHLTSERDLRAKRYKVESQLVAVLQKYDTDIGERQAQLEEMTASYEEEKEQMKVLQEQFDEQETEYVNLMLEKEHYERQQWEAKLYDIRCRIAARKIQRYFRAYLVATRAKGKKGKKGKKKK